MPDLCRELGSIPLAPGAEAGLRLLRSNGIRIAIVSITWSFAVEWFCKRLAADYGVGTTLDRKGTIGHFWPADKAAWVAALARRLGLHLAHPRVSA